MSAQNPSPLTAFIQERCHEVPGIKTGFNQFCLAFQRWLPVAQRRDWSKAIIGRALDALGLPRGRGAGGCIFVGNVDLRQNRPRYVLHDRKRLIKEPALSA